MQYCVHWHVFWHCLGSGNHLCLSNILCMCYLMHVNQPCDVHGLWCDVTVPLRFVAQSIYNQICNTSKFKHISCWTWLMSDLITNWACLPASLTAWRIFLRQCQGSLQCLAVSCRLPIKASYFWWDLSFCMLPPSVTCFSCWSAIQQHAGQIHLKPSGSFFFHIHEVMFISLNRGLMTGLPLRSLCPCLNSLRQSRCRRQGCTYCTSILISLPSSLA